MFVVVRETFVLCLGVAVAAAAEMVFRVCGNKLELLPGIVVPICFCLGRLSFIPACPKDVGITRQAIHQLLRAFALIMLLLFEMGVGLFMDANDIPVAVWAILCGFGMAYVASIYIAELMRKSRVEDIAGEGDHCANATTGISRIVAEHQ